MSAKDIPEEFLSPYNYVEKEKIIYAEWEKSGYFNPDNLPGDRDDPYTIIMPPPNANGSLHVGHALFVALEDMMIRYNRMKGKRTLWLPGADHAGFETQVVYEKKLAKEGKSRFDFAREDLYQDILDFTLENKTYMENQLRTLGASCDWSREIFTLDPIVKEQVYDTFFKLHEDKLLYRNLRSIHWCSKHQTGFSELELEHEERVDPFYYFQYGPFVIGTVRPETKFGDKYVVMHPDDERYAAYKHGQELDVEWINGPVKATVIKDIASDPEKGSGVMTITPWHSSIDWEIAQRHGLSYEQIIDERGKLLPIAGEFAGMNITQAREKIVEKMKKKNLLVSIDESYSHSVPKCYKCGRDIESQLKKQWFITMQPLAKKAIEAIESGKVSFVTSRYEKIALNWLRNVQDWNISRQIVWGIPIPAVICQDCGHGVVTPSEQPPTCEKCGGKFIPDTDTFDTWFSSGQLPFITLGYPNKEDYKEQYPTNVMETGHDILFFWVLRMVMLGLYRTNMVPFKTIYLHGMVRDEKGQKQSKSKGNVVNPTDIAKEYGVDAMRMAYLVGNPPGENINFSLDKIRGYRNFANKLWNIGRFMFPYANTPLKSNKMTQQDEAYLATWHTMLDEITDDMEHYRFHLASEKIYHYAWHTFADVLIEESKKTLDDSNKELQESRMVLLVHIYTDILKTLHPFMPFVTEALWKHVCSGTYKTHELLMVEKWPNR